MIHATRAAKPGRPGRRRGREYTTYFTVIYTLALPFATAGWLRDALRGDLSDTRGPLSRARAAADEVTPTIFSA
ncbi:cytochrome PufQ [Limimaricola pyoseonensis]|uniref:PufQ cytochrome subunit n=1 Tax=Limimaricola pyoseonensis TaxID=521013 RepID=A0A1G7B0V8_9RHOB|nr:cytochrome PufQ [Limimaricola pyoseonensis]SDE20719.1 PufQ cytochrome subunit [Limimaricola pyoseonensis]